MWVTLKFHHFQSFTIARDPYIPSWVRVFYEAFAKVIAKSRGGVKITPKPIDSIEVWIVLVPWSETDINDVLGCTQWYSHDHTKILNKTNHDGIKAWLAPMIGSPATSCFEEGSIVEIKKIDCSSMVLIWVYLQQYNVLPKWVNSSTFKRVVGCIMDWQKLNLNLIIAQEILFITKQL